MTLFTWTSDASANWLTAADWSPSGPPGAADSALINATGTAYTVTIGTATTVGLTGLTIDSTSATLAVDGTLNASGALDVSNGTLAIANTGVLTASATEALTVASSLGSNGVVTVTGGMLTGLGGIEVGGSGTGSLIVSDGGQLLINGGTSVASQIGSDNGGGGGFLVINDGTVSEFGADFDVGGDGASGGSILVENGGQFISSSDNGNGYNLAADIDAAGTAAAVSILSGSTWIAEGQVNVGDNDSGTLDINDGLVNTGTYIVYLGAIAGGTGTLSVENSGTLLAGDLSISDPYGLPAAGTLTVGPGGTVTVATVTEGGGGSITVTGGSFSAGGLVIGQSTGTATAAVLTVGSLGVASDSGFITVGANVPGTLNVQSGGVFDLTGGSSFDLGQDTVGASTVTVAGLLNLGSSEIDIGAATGAAGVVIVNAGGTLDAAAMTLDNVGGATGTLTVNTGGLVDVADVTVNTGGVITLAGGVLDPTIGALTLNGSGLVQGYGTLVDTVALTSAGGTVQSSGGTLEITGTVSGSGTLDLASASVLRLDAAPGSTPTVTFGSGSPETLVLVDPTVSTSGGGNIFTAVTGIAAGDRIDFGSGIIINTVSVTSNGSVEIATLAVTQGGIAGVITLDNVQFTGPANAFAITTDGATGDASIQAVPCFAAGTRIGTDRGEVAVEDLQRGDQVRTIMGEAPQPIIWVGHRDVDCARHPKPQRVWPVRIAAGAFGPAQPHTDLLLSPDHAVYVNDVLIPVKHLINGSSIVQVPVARITYYHIELPHHDVVLAHGLTVESYLDMRDRSDYANGTGPIRLHPDFAVRMWEAFGCAPLIVSGAELEAARAGIDDAAAEHAAA